MTDSTFPLALGCIPWQTLSRELPRKLVCLSQTDNGQTRSAGKNTDNENVVCLEPHGIVKHNRIRDLEIGTKRHAAYDMRPGLVKWPPFRRRYFQMPFRVPKGTNPGDNDLGSKRRQAIMWNQCWPDTPTHVCGTGGRWINSNELRIEYNFIIHPVKIETEHLHPIVRDIYHISWQDMWYHLGAESLFQGLLLWLHCILYWTACYLGAYYKGEPAGL